MSFDPLQSLILQWVGKKLIDPHVIEQLDKVNWCYEIMDELKYIGLLENDEGILVSDKKKYQALSTLIEKNLPKDLSAKINETIIGKNVEMLGKMIGLTQDEQEIYAFLIIVSQQPILQGLFGSYKRLCNNKLINLIADYMGKSFYQVEKSISANSLLVKSSLLKIVRGVSTIDQKVGFLYQFDEFISDQERTEDEIASFFVNPVHDVKLTLQDYSHIKEDLEYVIPYLKYAIEHKTKGCNILLYGAPGTGKTELAKTLAQAIEAPLYEVKTEHHNQEIINPNERLESYHIGMLIFRRQHQCVVLFDEIEDLISTSSHKGKDVNTIRSKAWFNRLLEQNPVPTIWTSNSVEHLDKAYLRRFDIVIPMKAPPRGYRRTILASSVKNHKVDADWLAQVADLLPLAPSEGDRVNKVLEMAQSGSKASAHIRQLIQHSYQATTGQVPTLPSIYRSNRTPYRLDWINTNICMDSLIKALKKQPQAKLCLSGPSGTGKTQFAHHLAEYLQTPLLAQKASDLISPFLGGTENNLARLFTRASTEQAIILIDEADSFLSNRAQHHASWETTQVNEVLVQLEQFNGLMMASTNRLEQFDPATLRRFDLKIVFEYPTPQQVWDMFCHSVKNPNLKFKEQLMNIQPLTPGNFKVAERQASLLGKGLTPESLLEILKEESKYNQPASRPIGFIH